MSLVQMYNILRAAATMVRPSTLFFRRKENVISIVQYILFLFYFM